MSLVLGVPLKVTRRERRALREMAHSSVLAYRVVVQASDLSLAVDGVENNQIAWNVRRRRTRSGWRAKFEVGGIDAAGSIAPGRGRKPGLDQGTVTRSSMTRSTRSLTMGPPRVDAHDGGTACRQRHRGADLSGAELADVGGRDVQALERSELRGEAR